MHKYDNHVKNADIRMRRKEFRKQEATKAVFNVKVNCPLLFRITNILLILSF